MKKTKKVIKKPVKKTTKRKPTKRKPTKRKQTKRKSAKRKIIKKTSRAPRPSAKRPARGKQKKVVRKKPVVRRRRSSSSLTPLDQLFESSAKVQLMKLFFRNPGESLMISDIVKRLRTDAGKLRQGIKKLEKAGLLKSRKVSARKQSFSINPSFDFLKELQELILKSSPISREKMIKAIRRIGKIKLVLLSGIFVGSESQADEPGTTRADLLIVGDKINQRKLATLIKDLEAEAGTAINCAILNQSDFTYRYGMYDRFVRDLINEESEILLNKLDFDIM